MIEMITLEKYSGELSKQWHPTKNGNLKPSDVLKHSRKKVWWMCEKGHEWDATVESRVNGRDCPYCAGRRVLHGYNDLSTIRPDLAKQWHPTKNGNLKPSDFTKCSATTVWWMCEKGHEWDMPISSRYNGQGCPYCAGKRILVGYNDLKTRRPDLAKQWHPTKNGDLKPTDVSAGSSKKVWWLGGCNHEWESPICSQARKFSCPVCSRFFHTSFPEKAIAFNLKKYFPDLKESYPLGKTQFELDIYIPSLSTAIEYDGLPWHKKEDKLLKDEEKNIYCESLKINVIRVREAGLPKINHCKTIEVPSGNISDIDEVCIKLVKQLLGSESYRGDIDTLLDFDIIKKSVGVDKTKTIKAVRPDLASEWHPTKNGYLTPDDVTSKSSIKVWWICDKGHEWKALISNRANGARCPYCSGNEVLVGYNDLVTVNPDLAKQWHPTKNGNLKPTDFTQGSGTSVWWLGDCGHEWPAKINERTSGTGCPYCSGKKVLAGFNDLATVNPDLAKQWHPTKNGDLKPTDFTQGSNTSVWWLGNCGHEWKSQINVRSDGHGCPYCSGKKVLAGFNDLATVNPDLARQWHPTKNGDLKPTDVSAESHDKVWWMCEKGHEWKSMIKHRNHGIGCPYCSGKKVLAGFNDLATVNPDLAKQWHPTKNGDLKPTSVTRGSNTVVWWMCEKGHEWEASIHTRSNGHGCPYCSGNRTKKGFNDLESSYSQLASEWHPTKNGDLKPTDVSAGSNKKVWWICEKGHEWEATIGSRTGERGCPYCSGKKVLAGFNDLATVNPDLAKQWHQTKNGDLKPTDVSAGSNKKVWWMCEKGHEWEAIVNDRSNGQGCPYCKGKKVLIGFNDLSTTNSYLASEWHPTKNGDLKPTDVSAGSNKKVWWMCEKGHEWEATVYHRNKGQGCPYCAGKSK